jgi:hypothetical protein
MSVTIVGKVKYARHMQGKTADGKEYSFFSFVVLDTDEGVRWPLQLQSDHPQFDDLAPHADRLMDADVTVVVRSFSAGYRKDKESGKQEPQARFFAKDVRVTSAVAARK